MNVKVTAGVDLNANGSGHGRILLATTAGAAGVSHHTPEPMRTSVNLGGQVHRGTGEQEEG